MIPNLVLALATMAVTVSEIVRGSPCGADLQDEASDRDVVVTLMASSVL